jgi:hypothetical protein
MLQCSKFPPPMHFKPEEDNVASGGSCMGGE